LVLLDLGSQRRLENSFSNAKNIDEQYGKVEFKAPLGGAPTYVDELKAEGDWEVLQKYSGFEFDDNAPKSASTYWI
jgi:hypothetical protein